MSVTGWKYFQLAELVIAELFIERARLKIEGVEKSMATSTPARLRFRFIDQPGTQTSPPSRSPTPTAL